MLLGRDLPPLALSYAPPHTAALVRTLAPALGPPHGASNDAPDAAAHPVAHLHATTEHLLCDTEAKPRPVAAPSHLVSLAAPIVTADAATHVCALAPALGALVHAHPGANSDPNSAATNGGGVQFGLCDGWLDPRRHSLAAPPLRAEGAGGDGADSQDAL